MRTPTWVLAVFLILTGAVISRVWAETDDMTGAKADDYVKSRAYIGIMGTSADIDQWGDFTGVNFFTNVTSGSSTTDPERDYIPSITRQFGWGVLLGYREGPWAAELSFMRSDHTATFVDSTPTTFTTPASLQSIDINVKRYFFTKYPIQPYINLGFSMPWLWVRQFSFLMDPSNPTTALSSDDETISGIGLNLGAGLEFYFENDFSIMGGLFQRWGEFDQINGAAKIPFNNLYFDGNPAHTGALSGNALNFYLGATVGVE